MTKVTCFLAGFLVGTILVFWGMTKFVKLIAEETHAQVVWTGPEIPKCDKELWKRITDGCD